MRHSPHEKASIAKDCPDSPLVGVENLPELIRAYENICASTSQQIRASGRVQKYFYLSMGMSRSTFERRMRTNAWTLKELWMLAGLLG